MSRQEVISLPPCQLDNIRHNINQRLKKDVGTCSQDGIVTDISDVQEIESLFISKVNGHTYFRINYDITMVKPEQGSVYTADVLRIYNEGLFCSAYSMDILIPAPTLVNWHYNGQFFQHQSGKTVKVGDTIRLKVIAVRYDRKYQCLAELIFDSLNMEVME